MFTEYNGKYFQVNIDRNYNRPAGPIGPTERFVLTAYKRLNDDGGHDDFEYNSRGSKHGFDIGLNMAHPELSRNYYDYHYNRSDPALNYIDKSRYFDLYYVFGNGMKKPIIDRSEWNG